MALLEILKFPDSRLRIKAKPVTTIDAGLHHIVENMYETMYANEGVGLAGTQVNIHYQLFTMDVSSNKEERFCILNPRIIAKEGNQFEAEGCLSVGGGAFDKINRAFRIRLKYMNLKGETVELDAEGLMAACIQHEIDHLNGKLFIDHLSRLKQDRIRKKIEKVEKRG